MIENAVIHWVIPIFATSVAILALARANIALQRSSKRATGLEIAALERMVADLNEEHRALLESHKKLRSRVGMRELRSREAEPVPESPEEWKKRMRLELAKPKR